MPRLSAAAAALLLSLSALASGAESPGRERGVVVLPVHAPGADGTAAAPLVLLHEQLAREVSRGAAGAALLTTETPLVDYCREVLRTPHPVLLQADPHPTAAAQLPPPHCDGAGWRVLRALGWSLGLVAALASAALNYAAARLWLRVLAPAAAAAARGTTAVAGAALAPAAAAWHIGSAMVLAVSRATMLTLECLVFLTGPQQRELPPTLRRVARNATAALQDADGAALHAAAASRVASMRSLAATACHVALAPARAAAGVLLRAPPEAPAREAFKFKAEAEAEPMLVPAGASRAVDGELLSFTSEEDASPRASPRTADTRGPLHAAVHRLRRQSTA